MISEPHAQRIFEEVMRHSDADSTVAYLMGGKEGLTRFACNSIHQNVLKKDYFLKVIVKKNGKIGMSVSNIFGDENIQDLVKNALRVADHQTKPGNLWFNPEVIDYRRINLYDISVMEMTPADRALAVKEMFDIAANKNTELFGAYSVKDWVTAIASSTGFYGYHTETTADLTVTAMDDQKLAGWSEEHAHRIMEIDHRGAAKRAVEKVLLGKKKHTIQPGRYDVILEHAAVSSLLFWLVYLGMGGRSYAEGTSWLTGRLGEKLAGDNFTVTEDAMWPGTDGRTFDYQGFNRQAVTLFEKGVAKGLVHDMESASKAGCQSTGHGNPHPASYGPAPFNVRMDEGDSSIAEMIKNTERGIYVTHFHYENVVDPKVPIMTGMTRDGTFLVENGEIVGSIGNLRYNEKLLDVFSRMDSISSDRKLFFEYGKYQVPAVKVKDFQFTGASDGEAS